MESHRKLDPQTPVEAMISKLKKYIIDKDFFNFRIHSFVGQKELEDTMREVLDILEKNEKELVFSKRQNSEYLRHIKILEKQLFEEKSRKADRSTHEKELLLSFISARRLVARLFYGGVSVMIPEERQRIKAWLEANKQEK